MTNASTRWFTLAGLGIEADARSLPAVDAALAERFAALASGRTPSAAPEITVRYVQVDTLDEPPAGRPVYESDAGEVRYDPESESLAVVPFDGRSRALCDIRRSEVEIATLDAGDLWLLTRPLLSIPLLELLKRRGLFSIHASAVAAPTGALVFAGASGVGKTTLALALAARGFELMGDDFVFASVNGSAIELVGLPEQPDVTDETAALLGLVDGSAAAPGWPKRRLRLDRAAPSGWAERGVPGRLVFPELRACVRESALEPLSPDEAATALAPNILLTAMTATDRHLEVLVRLAASVPSYRLGLGRDLDAACALLTELAELP